MGTYVYSMRKKTTRVRFADEGSVAANSFQYAYKEWFGGSVGDVHERTRDRIRNRAVRTGSEAFVVSPARVAILGDVEDGASVYADVTSGTWIDTTAFPGRLVGWLRRQGGGRRTYWAVVDATSWEPVRIFTATGTRSCWRRVALYDGAAVEELVDRPPTETRIVWHIAGQRPTATVRLHPEAHPVY